MQFLKYIDAMTISWDIHELYEACLKSKVSFSSTHAAELGLKRNL